MGKLSDYFYSKVTRVGSAVALAAVVGLGVSATPAQAQWGNRDDRNSTSRRMNVSDIRRVATVNGYSAGYEEGVTDRRNRNRSGYTRRDVYREAMQGYDTSWGQPREYQNSFRQGYSRGYQDGFGGRQRNRSYNNDNSRVYDYRNSPVDPYSSYPSYGRNPYDNGNNGSYNGPVDNRRGNMDADDVARRAAQNGYTAGFERGQYDAQRDKGRPNPNPQGHGAYQFGLDGWSQEWGSGATYQQYYRSYFIQGYQDAYQQRSRNFNWRRL